jgi:hypothetical protein
MSDLQYVWIYEIYALLTMSGIAIWLYKKAWEVHHYQVGLVVLVLSAPLAIFVMETDDLLGQFILVDYIFLGLFTLLIDIEDCFKGIRNFEERIGWKLDETIKKD